LAASVSLSLGPLLIRLWIHAEPLAGCIYPLHAKYALRPSAASEPEARGCSCCIARSLDAYRGPMVHESAIAIVLKVGSVTLMPDSASQYR
jgi:hypothetical protein